MKLDKVMGIEPTGNSLVLADTVKFNGVSCNFYDSLQGDEVYVTREQIGQALEYDNPRKAVSNIHERHKDRLDRFSTVLTLGTVEGGRNVDRNFIVYSTKGIFEICRWSRQPKADAFMDFCWEVMERIRKRKITPPLTNDEIIDKAAMRVTTKLFPQFMKTVAPTMAKSIIEQVRSLPQGETLLAPPTEPETAVTAPEPTAPIQDMPLSDLPSMLTVADIKNYLGIGQRQAYELVHSKDFPAFKVSGVIRIEKRKFIAWLDTVALNPV